MTSEIKTHFERGQLVWDMVRGEILQITNFYEPGIYMTLNSRRQIRQIRIVYLHLPGESIFTRSIEHLRNATPEEVEKYGKNFHSF